MHNRSFQLSDADVSGADLRAANFEGVNVFAVLFDQKSPAAYLREIGLKPGRLWRTRYDIMLTTAIRCRGIRESCHGNRRFTRFLHDQEYLEEMQDTKSGTFKLYIWWLLADCGRSIARWALWSVLFAVFFCSDLLSFRPGPFPGSLFTFQFYDNFLLQHCYIYHPWFRRFCSQDSHCGTFCYEYIMLGGLISIFANKLARRGE